MKPVHSSNNHRKKDLASFDWETARKRIEESAALMTGEFETDPETLERIWQQRAQQLAQAPEKDADGRRIDLVLVRLGREDYALAAEYVYDIRPARQITLVPRVPEWVAGVSNLRGRIMSVLDLRIFFNLPAVDMDATAATQEAYLAVVRAGDMELALKVDQVVGVENVLVDQIRDSSQATQGIPPEYVLGLIEKEDRHGPTTQRSHWQAGAHSAVNGAAQGGTEKQLASVVVLNIPNLLADERLVISEELV